MKCIECGHELKDGAIFCIRCGTMQVSMDGSPIERDAGAAGGSNWKSATDKAMHSAQSKTPRGFQPAPNNNGAKIAGVVVAIIVVIAVIAFAVVSCMGNATSNSDSAESQDAAATALSESDSDSASSSAASSASSSASSASASASSSSASASASSASAESQQPAPEPEPAPEPAPEPEPVYYNDYYVLPSSSTYYYSWDELNSMSSYDLFIARNEVFARHGRMFNRADLQDYFNSQAWYQPVYTPAQWESMGNVLNDCEQKNVALMKQVEASKGSPYLQ